MKIIWYGHSCFRLETGNSVILIDPFLKGNPTFEKSGIAWDDATKGVTHVVIDTPAGFTGKPLDAVLRIADRVLIPLQPSLFDMQATHAFLNELRQHRRAGEIQVALVGMRVKDHTISNDQLHQFLAELRLPVLGYLRDTQHYVQLVARGLTVWDVAPGRVERDLEQWKPLVPWLLMH